MTLSRLAWISTAASSSGVSPDAALAYQAQEDQLTAQANARHPNFGGFLMLSLGCETNELQALMEDPRFAPSAPASTCIAR